MAPSAPRPSAAGAISRHAATHAPMTGWMRILLGALLLVACDAAAARAQRLEGRVLDSETNAPVGGATVVLVGEGGQAVHSALSDSTGAFVLRSPRPGRFRVRASRIGYTAATSPPVELVLNDVLAVEMRMGTSAVVVAPLTVTGRPRDPRLAEEGFYERRDHFGPEGLGEAVFMDQQDIERTNPFSVSDVLQNVRGVWVRDGRITMRRGCTPVFVVNGFTQRSPLPISTPRSLLAVEVYTGTAIPARYLLDGGGCGVVMFWTR